MHMLFHTCNKAFGFMLVLTLALSASASASASNLYVSKYGVDNSHCGASIFTPCHTIQYTIDNRSATGDVINIEAGKYSELVTVSKNLTLRGSIWGDTTIDGMQSGTVVTIAAVTASLEFLTIRNGLAAVNPPDYSGFVAGGIVNNGTLTLLATTVTENSATSSEYGFFFPLAGGVINLGTLNLSFSSIVANSGNGGCSTAGGLSNWAGTVTINDSFIAKNTLSSGPGCVGGPGTFSGASGYISFPGGSSIVRTTIFEQNAILNNAPLTLDRSTITGSQADGILNTSALTVVNSTITGNVGAGIDNYNYDPLLGTVDVSNSTITGNGQDGISFGEPLASTIRNSIIAGNGAYDCDGDFISGDYNLIQNPNGFIYVEGGHDIIGVSPDLRKLGFYGGPTPTLDLMKDSPAINAGNPAGCMDASGAPITTDQRGFPRPSPRSGRCDIGAIEVQLHKAW